MFSNNSAIKLIINMQNLSKNVCMLENKNWTSNHP